MDYRQIIQDSGYKICYIAKQIGVSRVMMSYFLSGKRNLSPERLRELNRILKGEV